MPRFATATWCHFSKIFIWFFCLCNPYVFTYFQLNMKRYSIFSLVLALALVFTLSSCGGKKDEALVAEFTAKTTEAGKLITDATDGMKKMADEHTAWAASLDEAAKAPDADAAKIEGLKK